MTDHADILATRLLNCYAAAVHDVLRGMGYERCVLPSNIRPLDPARKLAGEIYTVSGHIDFTRDPHDTLVQWTGLLSKAPAGKVLVCQPNTYEIALMGELSAETLNFRGVRGYVVDGGCRDTDFILELGFPVFCSFTTPKDIVGRWIPDRFGEHDVTAGDLHVDVHELAVRRLVLLDDLRSEHVFEELDRFRGAFEVHPRRERGVTLGYRSNGHDVSPCNEVFSMVERARS